MSIKKPKKGFTLVEVLIAVFIFTIGILAIIGNLPWLVGAEKVTEMYTVASILAERQMELIQSDPDYDALATTYNDSYSTRRNISGYPQYKSCLKVSSISGTYNDLKKITVIIFWTASSKQHSFTLVGIRKRG